MAAFLRTYRDDTRARWLELEALGGAETPPVDEGTRMIATLWFEDAKGSQWESVFESPAWFSHREMHVIGSPRRISPPTRR
jgi:hypothetical protein